MVVNNTNKLLKEGNADFANYAKLGEARDWRKENPPFAWPGNAIKNIGLGVSGGQTKMVRGFMRSILTDVASKFTGTRMGNYRLNFQFNPDYIERSVTQSIGAINPILQAPANLTQPVPGTAVFTFTMTFNREMEVNNAGFTTWNKDRTFLYAGTNYIGGNIKNPALVGVWADLQMFDLIIGQGITKELLDLVSGFSQSQDKLRQAAAIKAWQTSVEAAGDDKDKKAALPLKPPDTTFNATTFNIDNTLNFGNSAFINPLPVRVVFSDVFMIEGLVTGSAVAFQKFNQNMIPTVCQVNVSMTALYAGFARKEAYLTNALNAWADSESEDQKVVSADTKSGQDALTYNLKSFSVLFNRRLLKPFEVTSGKSGIDGDDDTYLKTGPDTSLMMRSHTQATEYYPGTSTNPRFVTLQQYYNILFTKHWGSNVSLDTDFGDLGPLGLLTSKQKTNKGTLPIVIKVEIKKSDKIEKIGWNFTCALQYGATKSVQQVSMVNTDDETWYLGEVRIVGSVVYETHYKEFLLDLDSLQNIPKYKTTPNTNYLVSDAEFLFTIQGFGNTTSFGSDVVGTISEKKSILFKPATPLFYHDDTKKWWPFIMNPVTIGTDGRPGK